MWGRVLPAPGMRLAWLANAGAGGRSERLDGRAHSAEDENGRCRATQPGSPRGHRLRPGTGDPVPQRVRRPGMEGTA